MANEVSTHPPLYVKLTLVLLGIIAFFSILYIGRAIIMPLVFATLIAIALNPLVNRLCDMGVNRILGIAFAVLATLAVVISLVTFISWQATMFSDTFSQFKTSFNELYTQGVEWASEVFKVSERDVNEWVNDTKQKVMDNSGVFIGKTVGTISAALTFIFLLPVYIFMILYYKPLLLQFIAQLFPRDEHEAVLDVLNETKRLIQSYLIGLMLETAIIAVLNSIGFLAVGLQYAILLGIIGAILNLIPYIGGLIAISLPMALALVTKSPSSMVVVGVIYLFVQFLDNNFLVPKIVASKVRLNALVSIVAVLVGGALWGVMGMFLSIPLVAIAKVIFDRIQGLNPWGYLLGDDMPAITKQIFRPIRRRAKKAS